MKTLGEFKTPDYEKKEEAVEANDYSITSIYYPCLLPTTIINIILKLHFINHK